MSKRGITETLSSVPPEVVQPFWDRFLTSAGFAGCMAVVAAVIAAMVTWRQLSQARKHSKEDRWWETLTWVLDRSGHGESKTSSPLPIGVTLSMLEALVDGAKSDHADSLRLRAVGAFVTMFQLPSEDTRTPDDLTDGLTQPPVDEPTPRRVVVEENDAPLLSSLRSAVGPSSPAISAAVYETKVYETLMMAFEDRVDWHLSRHPVVPKGRPDFVLRTPEALLVIEAKYVQKQVSVATVAGWLGHVQKYVDGLGPTTRGVLVCNQPLTERGREYWRSHVPGNLRFISWDGDDELGAAITAVAS